MSNWRWILLNIYTSSEVDAEFESWLGLLNIYTSSEVDAEFESWLGLLNQLYSGRKQVQ
jgi:hypothetical protein